MSHILSIRTISTETQRDDGITQLIQRNLGKTLLAQLDTKFQHLADRVDHLVTAAMLETHADGGRVVKTIATLEGNLGWPLISTPEGFLQALKVKLQWFIGTDPEQAGPLLPVEINLEFLIKADTAIFQQEASTFEVVDVREAA